MYLRTPPRNSRASRSKYRLSYPFGGDAQSICASATFVSVGNGESSRAGSLKLSNSPRDFASVTTSNGTPSKHRSRRRGRACVLTTRSADLLSVSSCAPSLAVTSGVGSCEGQTSFIKTSPARRVNLARLLRLRRGRVVVTRVLRRLARQFVRLLQSAFGVLVRLEDVWAREH